MQLPLMGTKLRSIILPVFQQGNLTTVSLFKEHHEYQHSFVVNHIDVGNSCA